MLASDRRLKGKRNFDRVKKLGNLYQSTNFGVAVANQKDKGPTRFGFVVSTKISKHAAERNRIKRALREAVRYNLGEVKEGLDIIFLTKKSIAGKATDEIMNEVANFVRGNNL